MWIYPDMVSHHHHIFPSIPVWYPIDLQWSQVKQYSLERSSFQIVVHLILLSDFFVDGTFHIVD
jgi:hypothetical protein